MKMKISKELLIRLSLIILGLVFVYFFTFIVVYLVLAAVVALLGRPLKEVFVKIKIKGKSMPIVVAALLTITTILSVLATIIILVIPAIVDQTSQLTNLDFATISQSINQYLTSIEGLFKDYKIIGKDESLALIIQTYLTSLVSDIQINKIATDAVYVIGELFVGFSSVLFISFFFIKDEDLFQKIILVFIPESRKSNIQNIFLKIESLLSRYFVGLLTEIGAMMIIESIGGLILGLPNAILIGFLGGLLNVIPYLGPLLAGALAVVLVFISNFALGIDAVLPLIYGVIAIFVIANTIDSFLLQPFIYSNSVKAHPLEIFIVIIVGGSIYGAVGMIIAIPIYTMVKVIAKEFLGEQSFVQKVTKSI